MCYKCTEEYIATQWSKAISKFIDQEILKDIIKEIEGEDRECVWEHKCDQECVEEHCPKHGLKWKLKNQL